jgi:hypothetical protein
MDMSDIDIMSEVVVVLSMVSMAVEVAMAAVLVAVIIIDEEDMDMDIMGIGLSGPDDLETRVTGGMSELLEGRRSVVG